MYDFISLSVKCPECGHSLMDQETLVDNKPSIRLDLESENKKGSIFLSSIYGSFNFTNTISLSPGAIVKFSCPHCHKHISSRDECLSCKAPMVPLYLEFGGKVSFCSRSGCKNHFVEFEDLSLAMQKLYDDYGYETSYHHENRNTPAKETTGSPKPPEEKMEVLKSGTFLNTYCPFCHKSLIENDLLKLTVKKDSEGYLMLSPYLNVFTSKSTIYLPEDQTVEDIECPHCGKSLVEDVKSCGTCGSPVARIEVSARTKLIDFYICTKKGCRWHGLNQQDMNDIRLDDSLEW